jgi:hypothetical protein
VRDGKLERVPVDISEDDKVVISDPRLYLYNPRSNESHEITFDEAQALQLDDRKKSPDGFEAKVSFGSGGPFGGSSEGGAYLSGHMTSHKLDLRGIERVYDFQFVGWVTP